MNRKPMIRAFCQQKQVWVRLNGFDTLAQARAANPGLSEFEYEGWNDE